MQCQATNCWQGNMEILLAMNMRWGTGHYFRSTPMRCPDITEPCGNLKKSSRKRGWEQDGQHDQQGLERNGDLYFIEVLKPMHRVTSGVVRSQLKVLARRTPDKIFIGKSKAWLQYPDGTVVGSQWVQWAHLEKTAPAGLECRQRERGEILTAVWSLNCKGQFWLLKSCSLYTSWQLL